MAKEETTIRKITIAAIMGQLDENYQTHVLPSMTEYAIENNVNLITYVENSLGEENFIGENCYVLDRIFGKENIDGIIINAGAIGYWNNSNEILSMVNKFTTVPVVSIGINVEGNTSILSENSIGIKELIKHLILEHECTRIGFIRGGKENEEAEIRFKAYRESLEEFNIKYDGNLVVLGEFSRQLGEDAIELFFEIRKVKLDAIICVDDETAVGVYKALNSKGIKIPNDIIVTGFDDTKKSVSCVPSLTTIKQKFNLQGKAAMEAILRIIRGDKVPQRIVFPTEIVLRESCGCTLEKFKSGYVSEGNGISRHEIVEIFKNTSVKENLLIEFIDIILKCFNSDNKDKQFEENFIFELNKFIFDNCNSIDHILIFEEITKVIKQNLYSFVETDRLDSAEVLLYKVQLLIKEKNILKIETKEYNNSVKIWLYQEINQDMLVTYNYEKLLDVIEKSLNKLDISSCFITLYGKENQSKLLFAYDNRERIKINKSEEVFETKKLLPLIDGKNVLPNLSVVMPLYFKDDNYGLIIFDHQVEEKLAYEVMRNSISAALKNKKLFDEQIKAETELKITLDKFEQLNNQLKNLSVRDELTALYNRRGFYEFAEFQYHKAKIYKKNFVLFFIDLDEFKAINDNYGHIEGDFALKGVAEILDNTFRKADLIFEEEARSKDIIARLGGDEFIVMLLNASEQNVEVIKNRFYENINKYNRNLGKEYSLKMSIGVSYYDGFSSHSFEDLLILADKDLYNEKEKRKQIKSKIQ